MISQRYRLTGKTLKGKNRVRELGDVWVCVKGPCEVVAFASGVKGPWLLLEPAEHHKGAEGKLIASRWVNEREDANFVVEKI